MTTVASLTQAWPSSWAVTGADERIGHQMVEVMREFMSSLEGSGLSGATRRRHLDNLWLLGGELVHRMQQDDTLRLADGHDTLLAATSCGDAPLIHGITDAEQLSVDRTARRLLRFLNSVPKASDADASQ